MLTYFKRYEIAACAFAVAIPLIVSGAWSAITGRAMLFTAAGAVVCVVLLLAGLFVFTRLFAGLAQRKTESLVSLYNDGCDAKAFADEGRAIAESAEGPLNEMSAWYLSFYANALIDVGKRDAAAKIALLLQDSVKDAPDNAARLALYADLVPITDAFFGPEQVRALADEALALPVQGADAVAEQRENYLGWARATADAKLRGDMASLLANYRVIWSNVDQCMRLRVEYAEREGRLHLTLGNDEAARGCMRFAAENGRDLPAARRARAYFGEHETA